MNTQQTHRPFADPSKLGSALKPYPELTDTAQPETGTHSPLEKLYKEMWETEKAHAERLAEALNLALVQWPCAHRDQPRIIAKIKEALAQWEQQ